MAEQMQRDRAEHIRGKLVEQLQALKLLERDLKTHPGASIQERKRADTVVVAIAFIEHAVSALEMATER
jgi:hypothetical protein